MTDQPPPSGPPQSPWPIPQPPPPHQAQVQPPRPSPPTVGYAVGSMFGELWKAIAAPVKPTAPAPTAASPGVPAQATPAPAGPPPSPHNQAQPIDAIARVVREEQAIGPDGRLILRRTIIEEVQIAPPFPQSPPPGPPEPQRKQ